MRMISSTLIILRDPVRPVHKLGEPLESAIVPCCFGFSPSLERTAASDISHYKHIAFARLLKAQCLFDSTFFFAVNASNRHTPTDPPPFRYVSSESKDTPVPLAL